MLFMASFDVRVLLCFSLFVRFLWREDIVQRRLLQNLLLLSFSLTLMASL